MQKARRKPLVALLVLLISALARDGVAAPPAVAVQQQIAVQASQLRAGGGLYVQGLALASGSLISPKTYARYAFPYHQALAAAIRARGGRLSIHVCGKTTHVIDDINEVTVQVVNLVTSHRAQMQPSV